MEDVKAATVNFYESCVLDSILGDTLRPGGLGLTSRLAQIAAVSPQYTVLDIGCGRGATAFFLATHYNCSVTGIDLSKEMITSCLKKAEQEMETRVSFMHADAENLPFCTDCFDIVISECSFSLLPDKESAARNISRVLKVGGKLAMTDIILRGPVDSQLRDQIAFNCCLGGALQLDEYINIFKQAGLQLHCVEDHSEELKRVAFQLAMKFGSVGNLLTKMPEGPCHFKKEIKDSFYSMESFWQFLKTGRPGYALLVMTKRERSKLV